MMKQVSTFNGATPPATAAASNPAASNATAANTATKIAHLHQQLAMTRHALAAAAVQCHKDHHHQSKEIWCLTNINLTQAAAGSRSPIRPMAQLENAKSELLSHEWEIQRLTAAIPYTTAAEDTETAQLRQHLARAQDDLKRCKEVSAAGTMPQTR